MLAIHYTAQDVLHAAQLVCFSGERIGYLRTYASPEFFSRTNDLIRLDSLGNSIWLATGYDMHSSARAALLFFESPVGRVFAGNPATREAVAGIRGQVEEFLAPGGSTRLDPAIHGSHRGADRQKTSQERI